jgi:hypothetical protein
MAVTGRDLCRSREWGLIAWKVKTTDPNLVSSQLFAECVRRV